MYLDISTNIKATKSNKKSHSESGQKNNYSVCYGGDGRDRTDDLLNAIQALSQLSYAPIKEHTE